MARDAAVAPGVFLHGDLGASCAAALAVRSSGAARGPGLSAADRAACWRRDVLLSGIFGHNAVAAVLDLRRSVVARRQTPSRLTRDRQHSSSAGPGSP